MDAWVLENIDTMAGRIAVPSRITILALERVTGSLQCHICDLTISALASLRCFVATDSVEHRLTGQSAAQAWQLIDASRHYATFNHRHAYADPELRMRVPPAWVPMLLPGVARDADDFVFAALAERPLDAMLSPWLPVGLVDSADGDPAAGGVSLSALHAESWTDDLTTWVLARTAEIHAAIGNHWQLSAALSSMQIRLSAAPSQNFIGEQASELTGEQMLRVIAAMQVLARHHPAWGSLPAYHWLNAARRRGEQTHRIDAAQADPDRMLAQLLNAVETEGGGPAASAFLRTIANASGDE